MQKKANSTMLLVWILLGFNMFSFGFFTSADWLATLAHQIPNIQFYLKSLFTIICALVILLNRRVAFDKIDHSILLAGFIFNVFGDTFFTIPILQGRDPGTFFIEALACFGVFHIINIVRMIRAIQKQTRKVSLIFRLVTAIALIALDCVLIVTLILPTGVSSFLVVIISSYCGLLSFNLWASINAMHGGYYPKPNGILLVAAIFAFFACDIVEGIKIAVGNTAQLASIANLPWLFYGPALFLLALSTAHWNPKLENIE